MKKEVTLGIILALLLSCWAQGEVFISPSQSRDEAIESFETIQEALDRAQYAAQHVGEDEAVLRPIVEAPYVLVDALGSPYMGENNTNLRMYVPKTLLAIDANGLPAEMGQVVIDCEGSARGFLFLEGQNLTDVNEPEDVNDAFIVSGFKVINGYASEGSDPEGVLNPGCGGGMLIDAGYPIIENCMFTECLSDDFAGGGMAIGAGEDAGGGDEVPLIRNSIFYRNRAYFAGGGIAVRREAAPNFINCLIVNNYADSGGALYAEGATPNFELCTLADNYIIDESLYSYLGVYTDDAQPTFTNCILWGNTYGDSDSIEAENCLVEDIAITGDNILYVDPMFVTGMYYAVWGDLGLYYLDPTAPSPAVDAGTGTLANPYNSEYAVGISRYTSPLETQDRGSVDLGFHYPRYRGPDIPATLTVIIDSSPANGRVEIGSVLHRDNTYDFDIPYDANGVYTLSVGDRVSLVAVPDPNYRVRYWIGTNDDGILDLDNLGRTVNMYESEIEIHCSFERDVPSILNYPGQYLDLQYAINIARNGDTIVIHPGLYRLPGYGSYYTVQYYVSRPCLSISNKVLTIRSVAPEDPATVAATIIEPSWGFGTAIELDYCTRNTVISGLTIRNANLFGASGLNGRTSPENHPDGYDGSSVYGAGMRIYGSGTVTNCVFQNCTVTGGNGGNGVASDNWGYDGGQPGWAGGGAVVIYDYYGTGGPIFKNTRFVDCYALSGNGGNGASARDNWGRGGGYRFWSAPYGSEGTRIEHTANGGAVYVYEGDVEFEDCMFENCYAQSGFTGSGGAPYVITDIPSAGGAVYIGDDQYITGSMYGTSYTPTNSPSAKFTRTTFLNNQTALEIVNTYDSPYLGYGGAVAADYTGSMEFVDCQFMYNRSHFGGAVYWASRYSLHGGSTSIKIEGSSFTANEGLQGGAIYGIWGTMSLLDSKFELNTAKVTNAGGEPNAVVQGNVFTQGGAVYLGSANGLIGDCTFTLNEVTHSGGALCLSGFDQPTSTQKPHIYNNLFVANKADRDGGALVCTDGSEPNIVSCTMVNNMATGDGFAKGSGGGLSATVGSRVVVENCLLWGNSAQTGSQMSLVDPNGGGAYQLSYATVMNSMLQGGQSGIATDPGSYLTYEASNIQGGNPGFVYDYVTQVSQFMADYAIGADSPCVDAGSIDLESPVSGRQPVLPLGRYAYTLRTDSQRDTDIIDIGYHRRKAGEYPTGDIDFSGTVDTLDLAAMYQFYLYNCSYPDWCEGADISRDGLEDSAVDVNGVDFALLAQLYGAGDVTAPLPNPAQWLVNPTASSTTSITMTATTGLDNSGNAVEYFFEYVPADGTGGDSSGWQTSSTYTDTALTTGLEYGYRVKVRDVIPDDPDRHNETGWSSTLYGYAGEDGRAPNPNPSQWATPPYATSATSVAMTATAAIDASGVEYYFRCESGHNGYDSGWQASHTFVNEGLTPGVQYSYSVRTRDKSAAQNTGGLSTTASATTFQLPDTECPIPGDAQWLLRPYGVNATSIAMAAAPAYDPSGVEYFFECTFGGHDHDSGWQQSNFYTALDLMPDTAYTFVVYVRDRSVNRNTCTPSVAVTAYTFSAGGVPGAGLPPLPDPMQFMLASAWDGAETGRPTQVIAYEFDEFFVGVPGYYHVMTATWAYDSTLSTLGVQYYFECVTYPRLSSGWIDPLYFTDVGVFYYVRVGDVGWPKKYVWRVKARDVWGIETAWSPAYVAGGN